MNPIKKLDKQTKTLDNLFRELVDYFNIAGQSELSSSTFDDFGLFRKWKFHIQNQKQQHIVLFSVSLRESNPDIFILEDVNDEIRYKDILDLKTKTITLLKERIELVSYQNKLNEKML